MPDAGVALRDSRLIADPDYARGLGVLRRVAGASAPALADSTGMLMFTPACLAADRLEQGLRWLARHELTPVFGRRVVLREEQVRTVWRYQAAGFTPERWDVAVQLFCAGPAAVVLVSAEGDRTGAPVSAWLRELKGPSDPAELEPHQLRHALGAHNKINNLVHCPDSPPALLRELAVLLPEPACEAAWGAALAGRPALDVSRFADAARPARTGPMDVVRTAARMRWRCLELGRHVARVGEPPGLAEALGAQLDWAERRAPDGHQGLAEWRVRYGGRVLGERFASWLSAGPVADPDAEALARAFGGIEAVLRAERVDVEALTADIRAARLAPDRWELLALATEATAEEVLRCG
jgi:hypothetical protein